MSSVSHQIFIHLNGDVLKTTFFKQGADILFTDPHMLVMLQTNMNNSVFFQIIHGSKIELIDPSDMVQLCQIRLDFLDIHSFWYSIEEYLERTPKTWNGFWENKEGNSKGQERIQDIPVGKSEKNGHQDNSQPAQGIFQKVQAKIRDHYFYGLLRYLDYGSSRNQFHRHRYERCGEWHHPVLRCVDDLLRWAPLAQLLYRLFSS